MVASGLVKVHDEKGDYKYINLDNVESVQNDVEQGQVRINMSSGRWVVLSGQAAVAFLKECEGQE